jgi:hypothetical protein
LSEVRSGSRVTSEVGSADLIELLCRSCVDDLVEAGNDPFGITCHAGLLLAVTLGFQGGLDLATEPRLPFGLHLTASVSRPGTLEAWGGLPILQSSGTLTGGDIAGVVQAVLERPVSTDEVGQPREAWPGPSRS